MTMSPKYEHPLWAYCLNGLLPGLIFWQAGMKKTAVAIFLTVVILSIAAEEYSDTALMIFVWILSGGLSLLAFMVRAREHMER